ncbi:MAG: TonB-dependent receptor [Myxococcales bacterium]|nr:TonB-dependent receptor [Myxococcales bacterium]
MAPNFAAAASDVTISGVVTDTKTGEKINGALVILQCTCLQGQREMQTNAEGLYSFRNLPQGKYTVQVLFGQANVNKSMDVPPGAKFRANFSIDPNNKFRIDVDVVSKIRADTSTVTKVKMDEIRSVPVGGTSRDFTAVVDLAPTASRDQAGIRLAGTTGAESKYVVDGANTTSPAFGTVSTTIVQEFIEDVEVIEAGYDAEFSGAAGGIVRARRVGGTNKFRGQVLLRFSPRVALPRFIADTDEALRVAEVMDYEGQGVFTLSGPIVKDKLFFSIGVSPGGQKNSMIQSFYRRRDKDRSGGYEDCPYENGTNDCAANGNYIDSVRFAQQRFRTGRFDMGWQAVLDWQINPKHRLRLGGGGGPSFVRSSFRLPPGAEPNSFGTNPTRTIGGVSRVAQGVVNESFGTNLGNGSTVNLDYEGRVADDKLEIDASIFYFRARSADAWKLDDPNLKNIPLTQERDTQGRNLYDLLDRDGAVRLVDGVDDACNNSNLPGLTCPTRNWLSGGVGSYSNSWQDRVGGQLALTHFVSSKRAGSHQIKYGTEIDSVRSHTDSRYSGSNTADFYQNCASGLSGGGEYCFDPSGMGGRGEYIINTANRVNNNRAIIVDADNPDQRTSIGYGRARLEQDDLRAIATSIGAGIRAPAYQATLSTQNYGVFLQDKWAILSNLYLNAGVRWDMQDMKDVMGNRQIFIWDNVAPRIGMVYDWTDEGKSRLYASYGWFYQQIPAILNSRAFGGLVNVNRTYRASDCATPVLIGGESRDRTINGAPTEYCTDFNSFTTSLTENAIVPRLKGQYNQQFQVGYEQEVIEDLVLGVNWIHNSLGRAVEDVSTNGGLNFIIANPGESVSAKDIQAQNDACTDLQNKFDSADPNSEDRDILAREINRCNFLADAFTKVGTLFNRPVRNYDAWTFQVKKRFAKNWLLTGSYTYSRLIGNYDGFVARNTGAINIGSSTQFDIPELVRNSYGPLFDNRPHTVKLNGFYQFDLRKAGRFTIGGSFNYISGTPISIYADNNRYPGQSLVYVLPRGAGGRIEPSYYANIQLSYAYPLPGELELEFTARLVNITNNKAVLRVDETYSYSFGRAIAGGDLEDLKHSKVQNPNAPTSFFQRGVLPKQGNFGVQTVFQQPLQAQFELRLRF